MPLFRVAYHSDVGEKVLGVPVLAEVFAQASASARCKLLNSSSLVIPCGEPHSRITSEIGCPIHDPRDSVVCCICSSGDGSAGFIKNDGAAHPVVKRLAINREYKANVNLFIFKTPDDGFLFS